MISGYIIIILPNKLVNPLFIDLKNIYTSELLIFTNPI